MNFLCLFASESLRTSKLLFLNSSSPVVTEMRSNGAPPSKRVGLSPGFMASSPANRSDLQCLQLEPEEVDDDEGDRIRPSTSEPSGPLSRASAKPHPPCHERGYRDGVPQRSVVFYANSL